MENKLRSYTEKGQEDSETLNLRKQVLDKKTYYRDVLRKIDSGHVVSKADIHAAKRFERFLERDNSEGLLVRRALSPAVDTLSDAELNLVLIMI